MKCSVDRKPLSVQYILQVNKNTHKPHEIEFTYKFHENYLIVRTLFSTVCTLVVLEVIQIGL